MPSSSAMFPVMEFDLKEAHEVMRIQGCVILRYNDVPVRTMLLMLVLKDDDHCVTWNADQMQRGL